MKLGAVSFMTDYSIDVIEFARTLEEHGYESIWAGDHSHIPVSERARGTDVSGEPLRQYKHLLDPVVVLSAAATATRTLMLGTGMLLLAQREPIQTAKSLASIDYISGGRLIVGVASGWNVKELRNHGTDPAQRWAVLEERLEAMREIWSLPVAEHHGEQVDFTPLAAWPKPSAPPPVIIGCEPRHFHRVVAHGDGWGPLIDGEPGEGFERQLAALAAAAGAAGREPLPVTVFRVVPAISELVVGSELVVSEREIVRYAEAGVDRLVVVLPPEREAMLPLLEHYARLCERVAGAAA